MKRLILFLITIFSFLFFEEGFAQSPYGRILTLDNSGTQQWIDIGTVLLNYNTYHSGMSSPTWLTNGNAITTGVFLGTTNNMPLIFKVNNTEGLRLSTDNSVQATGYAGAVRTSFLATDATNSTFRVAHPSSAVVAIGGNTDHVLQIGGFASDNTSFDSLMSVDYQNGQVRISSGNSTYPQLFMSSYGGAFGIYPGFTDGYTYIEAGNTSWTGNNNGLKITGYSANPLTSLTLHSTTTTISGNTQVNGNFEFSGALMPNGNAGTSGQVLTSQGSGTPPMWTTISFSETDPLYISWIDATGSTSNQILRFNGTKYVPTSSGDLTTTTNGVTITGGSNAIIGSGATINIATASGTLTGLLTSTDWTTFNNKENALTFNSPLNRSVNTISISQASGTSDGYLSSSDWTSFSNRWSLSGNSLSGTEVFGSTNNQPILMITNNTDRFRFTTKGQIEVLNSARSVFLGENAGQNQDNSFYRYNVFLGYQAGYSNTTGGSNTATGYLALYSNTTGNNNTAFGFGALGFNTTGNNNTSLGYRAGYNLTTGSNNILIGYNAQPSSATVSNEVTIGNSSNNSYRMYAASWTNASDARYKHDISDLPFGMDFILKLRPRQYIYNNSIDGKITMGFVAQEVQEVMKQYGMDGSYNLVKIMEQDYLGLNTTEIIPILVKAIQDQSQTIEEMKKENAELLQRLEQLERIVLQGQGGGKENIGRK